MLGRKWGREQIDMLANSKHLGTNIHTKDGDWKVRLMKRKIVAKVICVFR